MPGTFSERHGIHLPNMPLNLVPSTPHGPPTPRSLGYRLGAGGFRWAKLLQTDHMPGDARWLQERGIQVLVRVKGEALVYHQDVLRAIADYAGLATVLEIGNEPPADQLWEHAWYLNKVADECLQPAHDAGMQLCVGGWQAGADPPATNRDVDQRLRGIYNRFDALAVHCYDPFQLTQGQPQIHLTAWHAAFSNKPIYITEYGIAARSVPDAEKARRYGAFVRGLPPYVVAAFCFILGGTADFAAFMAGGYDPAGENSYWLTDAAWATLGRAVGEGT